jgi:hypothetical protein
MLIGVALGPVAGFPPPPLPVRAQELREPLRTAVLEAMDEKHGEKAAQAMWWNLFGVAPIGTFRIAPPPPRPSI